MAEKETLLLADIGGTHARFAWREQEAAPEDMQDIVVFACADYPSLIDAVQAYYTKISILSKPSQALFCVAGIVQGDQFGFTNNRSWEFSIEDVKQALGFKSLKILNDLQATALAIPHCASQDMKPLGHGKEIIPAKEKPIGVIAPGTGLGVSYLTWNGNAYQSHACEGGHVTIGAVNEREWQVLQILQQKFDHVSAERVCSGPGIENLYHALCQLEAVTQGAGLSAQDIASKALSKECSVCEESLDMMTGFLARIASDLSVSLGAFGGIYIAGGVAQSLETYLVQSDFREQYLDKGRFREYLNPIPTCLVTHPMLGLLGLSHCA